MQGQRLSFFSALPSEQTQRAMLCRACFLSCKMSLWAPVSSVSIWRALSLDVILRAYCIASTESLQATSPLPSTSSHYEVRQTPLLKGMDSRTSPCHEKSAEDASLKRRQSLWVRYQEGRFVLAHGFGGFQAKGAMLQNTLDGITCREHVRIQCEVKPVEQLLFTTICSQSN